MSRLSKLKQGLDLKNLDAVLISSVPNIIYLTNYSGFSSEEREGFLFITEKQNFVITDGRYSEAINAHIKDFKLLEISSEKPITIILKELGEKFGIKRLGFEADDITVSEYKLLSSCFNNLINFSIDYLRVIKTSDEIHCIQQACKLGDKTFKHILGLLKEGVTEKEIAFEIEFFLKKQKANISFRPIVAFGKNAAIPHHLTGNTKLKKNSFVLLDFGAKVQEYCSDMTRTVFFGSATAEQKRMYQTVLDAQMLAIKQLNNGSRIASSLDKLAREHIISQGYPTMPHSLGHGTGLEVHESPRLSPNSKDELKNGMVFSIEPGIYLPRGKAGIPKVGGVRIEDLVVFDHSRVTVLTKSPKHFIEL